MIVEQLTKEQAIELYDAKWWEGKTAKEICDVQLYQEKLCTDFSVFSKALSEILGRPVYTHEFADHDGLVAEYEGRRAPEYNPIESAIRIFEKLGRHDLAENMIVVEVQPEE